MHAPERVPGFVPHRVDLFAYQTSFPGAFPCGTACVPRGGVHPGGGAGGVPMGWAAEGDAQGRGHHPGSIDGWQLVDLGFRPPPPSLIQFQVWGPSSF